MVAVRRRFAIVPRAATPCCNDDDEHYHLDTEKDFGYIVELGNAGRIRPAER